METRDVSSWTEGENLWYRDVAALVTGTSKVKVLVPYDVLFQLMELHAKVSDW